MNLPSCLGLQQQVAALQTLQVHYSLDCQEPDPILQATCLYGLPVGNAFLIALPGFIASYPKLAFSQDAYKKYQLKVLADAKSVEVQIIDQVKGGCWKSPSYSKTLVERQLLSNGVPISDDGDLYVVINGLGFPDHNVSGKRIGCSVYLELYINYFAPVLIPSRTKTVIGEVSVFQTGSLISAGNAVDKRAAELVVQWADEVSVLWLKARQKGVD